MPKIHKIGNEPAMSDATILISVENLINIAMGPQHTNVINYKMLQKVLHILARQMRMLETQVELRIDELEKRPRKKGKDDGSSSSPTTSPKSKAKKDGGKGKDEAGADAAIGKDKDGVGKDKDKRGKDGKGKGTDGVGAGTGGAGGGIGGGPGGGIDADTLKKGKDKKDITGKADYDEKGKGTRDKESKSESDEREKGKRGKDGKAEFEGREKGKMGKDGKSDSEEKEGGKGGMQRKGKGKRDGEEVIVVEKGPTTRTGPTSSRTRVGSIEVVTMSQFELLESLVHELKEMAGPLPMPTMPDNEQLRSDLVRGSASLADTMDAMQVQARVMAAEQAIERLAGMVTALASAGVLPEGLAAQLAGPLRDIQGLGPSGTASGAASGAASGGVSGAVSGQTSTKASGKSVAIDPAAKADGTFRTPYGAGGSEDNARDRPSSARTSAATSHASMATFASRPSSLVPVTHPELDEAIAALKAELMRNINLLTGKATTAADTASTTAKAVSDKLDIALKLNTRITNLHDMVMDYAEQLNGFDAGLTTQMSSFQEQMTQMRNDLKAGLDQLESANNNAETAAVLELTERYEALALELDNTVTSHQLLTNYQLQLSEDLRSLLEAVEMLREQKADRDEVLDGLRDKADLSRLNGLLTEKEFSGARAELETRLELCYEKFKKQEDVWITALKELTAVTENKAELMQLLAARDEAENALNDIQEKLRILFLQLGEPKAAILTRLLSRGGTCGACRVTALMEAEDPEHGQPPQLPAARPHGLQPDVCPGPPVTELQPPRAPDLKEHSCLRWVGGSHTLLGESVTREKAPPIALGHGPRPTRKYTGIGDDGRMYLFEEELQPCVACNKLTADEELVPTTPVLEPAPETGGGDNMVTTIVVAENVEKPTE